MILRSLCACQGAGAIGGAQRLGQHLGVGVCAPALGPCMDLGHVLLVERQAIAIGCSRGFRGNSGFRWVTSHTVLWVGGASTA